jgi:arylsulfatase A-like enzyme
MRKKFFMPGGVARYFTVTVLTACFYVLMEWIFFITKPSFMDFMSAGERVGVLFQASLFIAVPACALLLVLGVVDFALNKFLSFPAQFRLLPASLLASFLGLLLVDNFTYTVFKVGIISSTNFTRPLYILLLCFFLYYFYRELRQFVSSKKNTKLHSELFNACLFFMIVSVIFFVVEQSQASSAQFDGFPASGDVRKPNIIIFGTDGLDASHMSLYGYERKTTPVIDELAKTALVAENHFSNACCTTGSIGSTFTGKLPIETRFLYPPDILRGPDSYQHFVHILKLEGYQSAQWSLGLAVNAYTWNMLSGFDLIDEKSQQDRFVGDNSNYFMLQIRSRLTERVLHILYIKDMEKPLTSTEDESDAITLPDATKVAQIIEFIKNNNSPFFIHVHLTDTHGDKFHVTNPVFSAGQKQKKPWSSDFMDDAIMQYDQNAGRILDALKETGQYDNTIFIIYTDHGSKWRADKRIPLVIHFPHGEYAGSVNANTQNLDLAPTLLDYMNLSQPEWMRGNSLLAPVDQRRLIFSFDNITDADELKKPPFFQFGAIRVIECHKWYLLNLRTVDLESGEVDGHTAPCKAEDLRPAEEIRDAMLNLLSSNGYDISSLTSP